MHLVARLVASGIALTLAAFFGFFGYFKTFVPLATLAQHHAWTVVLPEWLGRIVGVSELLTALILALGAFLPAMRRPAAIAAGYLIVNQGCAALVHLTHGESAALPQNAVLTALCLIEIAAIHFGSPKPQGE